MPSRALLISHLARAVLFGALAGWLCSVLADVMSGWLFYAGCAALGVLGGWILLRPMERDTLPAAAVLWAVAGGVYYALRPPDGGGMLGLVPDIAGYAGLAGVVVSLGVGVLIGKVITRV